MTFNMCCKCFGRKESKSDARQESKPDNETARHEETGDSEYKTAPLTCTSTAQRLDKKPSKHFGPRVFTYEQLSKATDGFNISKLLGRGASGSVFRGMIPEYPEMQGQFVAVKRIAEKFGQGKKEFENEAGTISELRHRNLVKLKGWCDGQEGEFLLVYDYMPKGSLASVLHSDVLSNELHWKRRYEIGKGLGEALRYMHSDSGEKCVLHRDVKPSNVLLDDSFTAKLGDFGLSRWMDPDATSHLTARAGTIGYMAPELCENYVKATRETDVYAFGVLLLEVVTGKWPWDPSLEGYGSSDCCQLVDWVWGLYEERKELEAVDKRLQGDWEREEARRMLEVGLACSHPSPKDRPKIQTALDALEKGTAGLICVPRTKPWKVNIVPK